MLLVRGNCAVKLLRQTLSKRRLSKWMVPTPLTSVADSEAFQCQLRVLPVSVPTPLTSVADSEAIQCQLRVLPVPVPTPLTSVADSEAFQVSASGFSSTAAEFG